MTDIVERLRALVAQPRTHVAVACEDAADEIERLLILRGEVEELNKIIERLRGELRAERETVRMQADEIERLRAELAQYTNAIVRLREIK